MAEQKITLKKRAYSIFVPLMVLAIFLACLIISVTNDMYAFYKFPNSAEIEISSPSSIEDIATTLKSERIISNPHAFMIWARSDGRADRLENFVGRVSLSSTMSYREIFQSFSRATK